jgi:hypothetical protein
MIVADGEYLQERFFGHSYQFHSLQALMSAIGALLAVIVIAVLALAFGWTFLEVVVGLALGLVVVIGLVFIAVIVAVAVGLFRVIAG